MTAHTPGPWVLGWLGDGGSFEVGVGYHDFVATFVIASRNDVHSKAGESRANAHLIAAAPDLLNALNEVAHHADGEYGFMGTVRAAIAKAQGDDR